MWLTRFAISRPIITAMVFIGLALFGIISFLQLGRSSNPPGTEFPVVVVSAFYPGASPQDMERMIVKPIEDQMSGIDNYDHMTATAQEGTANVAVYFKLGSNIDLEAVDVQRRTDTARVFMPSDLDPPTVIKAGQAEPPLLDIAVSSTSLSQTQIADIVNNQVTPLIQQIPNVQSVNVYGSSNREFHVEPTAAQLLGTNATLSDVFTAIASDNLNVPGGIMTQPTQEATVAIHSYINGTSDILGIPLAVPNSSQKNLRIGDVANVYDSHVEMRTISHFNGKPRVYISINPTLDADQIKSTQIARAQLKTIEARFPKLQFTEEDAQADITAKELWGVGQSLLEGIFLTAIVMMLFLHAWRNAVVVLVAIPSSILSTFILMKMFGFHIDDLSMMGLSLIIGILVDDSIVVLENITRHRDLGQNPIDAAINGRTEIGGAAVAITMVDVVVFLPIAFMPGIVGEYLKEYGAVVVTATLFSLFVSFTLTPLLAAKWSMLKRSEGDPKWVRALDNRFLDAVLLIVSIGMFMLGNATGWFLLNVFAVFIVALLILNFIVHRYEAFTEFYREKLLPFALAHGSFVVFACAVLLLNAMMLVGGGGLPIIIADFGIVLLTAMTYGVALLFRLFGWNKLRSDNPVKSFLFSCLRGFSSLGTYRPLTITTLTAPLALGIIMSLLGGISFDFFPAQQTGVISMTLSYPSGTPIATTARYVTRLEDAILKLPGMKSVSSTVGVKPSGFGSTTGGNFARLTAQLDDNHTKQTNKAVDQIRKLAYLVPGGDLQVAQEGGNGSAVFYAFTGPEDQIGPAAEKVAKYLRTLPGTVNVQTSAEIAAPRLNVDIDPGKATLLGVQPSAAANVARIAVDGAVATKVRTPNGLVDVRVQFPQGQRNTIADLSQVRVRANNGMLVPLGEIATFSWTKAPTRIERLNRQRVVNVFSDLLPGYSTGQVQGPLQKKLAEPGFLPSSITPAPQGNSQWVGEAMVNLLIAVVTSFVLVYMLMVILYGSFLEPLIVMFSVPLAIIGALVFLAIMGKLQPEQGQSLNIISLLGIIMLFGLVSKNGILLVDYSNTLVKRGMRVRDAVLRASATRFRPILMTTAAMIFGMLPLALGYAEGGEWRQAMGTVIIGGLLSSLILTLFLVPMIYNTWMGYFERRADERAVRQELQPHGIPAAAAGD
ncbi:MAG TPA: efflux RND transporter permease subunit [Candidatus Rubrimentiphilum sp.]|nr:efflux RND transporter permease subunit [Candidatus Rubrimentiphilum sp.]